uniref:Olfactory receptor n=1 Tax=Gadus morhua TaxID=8049 RepID=A0A8C5C0E4_GADMO
RSWLKQSQIPYFILTAYLDMGYLKYLYFVIVLILLLYGATVLANLTVVLIVVVEKSLHEPMYVFLCNLCVNGVYGASGFYPKLLHDLLADSQLISYGGCLTQIFTVYSYVFCEYTNLAVMAYDRYVAICRPLQYHLIMTWRRVAQLLLLTWSWALLESGVGVLLTSRLPLCRLHVDKILCTNWAVVKLSCVDTSANNLYGFLLMVVHLLQALLIAVSYANIIQASRTSKTNRRKFFQTCLPHVTTLTVFTLSLMFDTLFSRYGDPYNLPALSNLMAAEFLVVPPLVNPLVYGMNLQRIHSQLLRNNVLCSIHVVLIVTCIYSASMYKYIS